MLEGGAAQRSPESCGFPAFPHHFDWGAGIVAFATAGNDCHHAVCAQLLARTQDADSCGAGCPLRSLVDFEVDQDAERRQQLLRTSQRQIGQLQQLVTSLLDALRPQPQWRKPQYEGLVVEELLLQLQARRTGAR